MVRDPALFTAAIIVAVYAAFCLACWAFNVKGARIAPILVISPASAGSAGYFLAYAVRW